MKKANLAFLFLLAGFYVFAQQGAKEAVPGGTIREMSGTVEIKTAESSSFVAAKAGDRLAQDTVISTSFKSFAIIDIGSSAITVRPLTRLTLTEIQNSNTHEALNVNLQSGRVRVDVKPPAGKKAVMSVQSPSATASVRGTSFEFDTNNLYVTSGSVSFAGSRGQQIMVNAGTSSRVEGNSKAASPIEIKTSSILPPTPVGADIATGIASGAVRTGVPFVIGLDFFSASRFLAPCK